VADDSGGWSAVESLLGDRYTREARLGPAFLSVFPIFLLLMVWFSGLRQAVPALLTLFCVFGVVRWISHIARGIGDRKEKELYRKWGGKPTTNMLRYTANRITIDKIPNGSEVEYLLREAPPLERIQKVFDDREGRPAFPTKDAEDKFVEEAIRHAAATQKDKVNEDEVRVNALDSLYERVTAWMRENSRDTKLVFEENISYGFQRNFFALKAFAVTCGLLSLAVQIGAALAAWRLHWTYAISHALGAVLMAATIAYLVGVWVFVTEDAVQIQGYTYARQLLDSLYGESASAVPAGGKGKSGKPKDQGASADS